MKVILCFSSRVDKGEMKGTMKCTSSQERYAAKLDGIVPGMRVKVGFAVDGREWTDPKTGKVRYFSDLTALRLERLDETVPVPEVAVPEDVTAELDNDREIPF